METTPTLNDLKLRLADFSNLANALDYAAGGVTGYRNQLTKRLSSIIFMEHGIDCLIHHLPHNTLPRTTSGKLSRIEARGIFLEQFIGLEKCPES